MDSHKNYLPLEEQEEERLRLKRKEWHAQKEFERKHEERKLKMIEEYERKRAAASKEQKSPYKRRSKSSSPQRREMNPPDNEHSKERKVVVNNPEGIIDKEELHKFKITIHNKNNFPTKNEDMLNKIGQDIVNPDDIILPRRPNEGTRPIFQSSEIKETEERRTIIILQKEQLDSEKPSTSQSARKNACTCKRLDMALHYCDSSQYKSIIRRDDQIDHDDNKYHDRSRSRKDREERYTSRRNDRKSSCDKRSPRSRSQSRYRSRNHSPINEQTKERRRDHDKNKFSSENYPNQSCELDNHVSSRPSTNHPFSNRFYNPYMHLSRPIPMSISMPIPMPRIQRPPVLMPIFPGFFPAPVPMNVHRWRPPLYKSRGRGNEFHRY